MLNIKNHYYENAEKKLSILTNEDVENCRD